MKSKKSVIIFGGGLSGLVTAYICSHSGINTTLIENTSLLGGGNKSIKDKEGNIFDYGYHALDYNRSLIATNFFKKILSNNFRKFKLKRGIVIKNHLIKYNEKINNWPEELKSLFPNKLKIDTIQGKLTRRKISNIFGKKFTNLAYEDILRSYPSINWSLENGGREEDFFGLVYPWFFPRLKKTNKRKSEWDVFHDKQRNEADHFILYPKKGGFESFITAIHNDIDHEYCKIIKNAKNIEYKIQSKRKKISSVKINGKTFVADKYFWCNSPISLSKILGIKVEEKIGVPQVIIFGNFVLRNSIKSNFHEILVGDNQHKINRISFPGKINNTDNKLIQIEYSFPSTNIEYDLRTLKKSWINSLIRLKIISKENQIKKISFIKENRGFVTIHNLEELKKFYRKKINAQKDDNLIIPSFNLGPENINRVIPDVILNTTKSLI